MLDLGYGRPDAALARFLALTRAGPGAGHFLNNLYAIPDLVESAVRSADLESAQQAIAGLELVVTLGGDGFLGSGLRCCGR